MAVENAQDLPTQPSKAAEDMAAAMTANHEARVAGKPTKDLAGTGVGGGPRSGSQGKSTLTGRGYKTMEYPMGLGDERYPHYVIFYINEYQTADMTDAQRSKTIDESSRSNKQNYSLSQQLVQGGGLQQLGTTFGQAGEAITPNAETAASVRSTPSLMEGNTGYFANETRQHIQNGNSLKAVGNFAGSALATGADAIGETSRKGVAAVLDTETGRNIVGAPGITLSALSTYMKDAGASVKRTTDAIVMHMPNTNKQSYSAKYNKIANGSALGSMLVNMMTAENVGAAAKEGMKSIIDEAGRGVGGVVGQAVGMEGALGAIDKLRGKIQNPKEEQLFNGVGFREHNFTYTFSPKSKSESNTIFEIIRKFKAHMHPLVQTVNGSGANYLIMPSEFDIEYYHKDDENTILGKIATCVLEDLVADYTPNSVWQAFDGTGYPPHITLSLQFKETAPIHRAMIEDGY